MPRVEYGHSTVCGLREYLTTQAREPLVRLDTDPHYGFGPGVC